MIHLARVAEFALLLSTALFAIADPVDCVTCPACQHAGQLERDAAQQARAQPDTAQPHPPARGQTVEPRRVVDGDTLDVLLEGKLVRVRLAGIDTPERGQPYFDQANRRLAELVGLAAPNSRPAGQPPAPRPTLRLIDTGQRSYGRPVGFFHAGTTDVGEALISGGFAWWSDRHEPAMHKYARAHVQAQQARRGLWADLSKAKPSNPIPPWRWREGVRQMPD